MGSVADGVRLALGGMIQKTVNENGPVGSHTHRGLHILLQATEILTADITGKPSPVPELKEREIPYFGVKEAVFPLRSRRSESPPVQCAP